MNGIFNMDNGFFTAVGKLVDIVIVSLLWVLLIIPIVTIGPATSAMYYCMVKVIRRERGYLVREFISAFKTNFKVGTLTSILLAFMYFVLIFDLKWAREVQGVPGFFLVSAFNSMLFLVTCISIYCFPILSRFKIKTKQLIKTSLFMSMKHLPSTILMAIIIGGFAIATYLIPILFILTPGLCCLLVSFLFERVFKKYMPEKTDDGEYNSKDEWYLE
jgi:uncharacterized membrane protein YesL